MIAFPGRSQLIGNSARRREDPVAGGIAERPAHAVEVTAFRLDTTEVTVESYGICVESGACTAGQ